MAITLTANASDGLLSVSGTGYVPSSGGQQVILWIGYPDDYCEPGTTTCHGFYDHPWVEDDGTFATSYSNALPQSGTGEVAAKQWNAKRKKWVEVARVSYTA